MQLPFLNPKVAPPTHWNKTPMPEQTCNFWERLTVGWLFPLFRTGYTRPITEEDVWCLAESRRANTVSQQLETNFYARCPPSRRPLHLGGIRRATADSAEEKDGVKSDDSEDNLEADTDHGVKGAMNTEGCHSPDSGLDNPAFSTSDQSTIVKTVSLMENVPTGDSPKRDNPPGRPHEDTCNEGSRSHLLRVMAIMTPALYALSRLNPWSSFQRSRKIEKGNVVIEEDELGVRRTYDSSLFWALIQTIWRRLLTALLFVASSSVLFTTSSLVTKRLIAYIATSHAWSKASELDRARLIRPKSVGTGIALAIGLALMQEAGSLLHSHYQGTAYTCGQCYWELSSTLRAMYLIRYFSGIIMKSAATDQIARKSFRLSPRSQVESTHGQQTSAIGADCGYIDQCFPYLVQIIVKPFTIVVGFVLLLLNLGPSALVGVAIMALASPMMALFCSDLNECRQQQLKMLDRRVRLTSEALSTIRQIKLYAYEGYFGKRITDYREKELARLRKRKRSEASHELDVATIFASLQLFNIIKAPLSLLPTVITAISDAHVAIRRISRILTAEERNHELIIDPTSRFAVEVVGHFAYETVVPPDGHASVNRSKSKKAGSLRRGDAKGGAGLNVSKTASQTERSTLINDNIQQEQPFALNDIDLRISKGAFVAILGSIGSGKSALLEGMLGEMRQTRGSPVTFSGSISLVTQTPWIQSATVKDNILFGKELDPVRLQQVIHACALARDLEQLSDGIDTEIGGKFRWPYMAWWPLSA
ncbi:hypothetical protein QFC20_007824 [Naganishia adeliensis]|uniref:Uncharacterized protein n=1 Tax=Naganishia adeliensis TaxID=92952 RepID=A0ACC2UWQ4_9TREE|nr:hypothetical protein QFC20_007824 [Naganishia adeliensis]